jgi:hypothetical protein
VADLARADAVGRAHRGAVARRRTAGGDLQRLGRLDALLAAHNAAIDCAGSSGDGSGTSGASQGGSATSEGDTLTTAPGDTEPSGGGSGGGLEDPAGCACTGGARSLSAGLTVLAAIAGARRRRPPMRLPHCSARVRSTLP